MTTSRGQKVKGQDHIALLNIFIFYSPILVEHNK